MCVCVRYSLCSLGLLPLVYPQSSTEGGQDQNEREEAGGGRGGSGGRGGIGGNFGCINHTIMQWLDRPEHIIQPGLRGKLLNLRERDREIEIIYQLYHYLIM